MTMKFSASTASKNCNFASPPTRRWAVPVKSTKSHVMPIIITVASVIRIFLSIKYLFVPFSHFYYPDADFVQQVDGQRYDEERKHICCRCDDGCHNENRHHRVSSIGAHHLVGEESHSSQKSTYYRQLKHDAHHQTHAQQRVYVRL